MNLQWFAGLPPPYPSQQPNTYRLSRAARVQRSPWPSTAMRVPTMEQFVAATGEEGGIRPSTTPGALFGEPRSRRFGTVG